jgi:Mg-chelatase subunit ChlD
MAEDTLKKNYKDESQEQISNKTLKKMEKLLDDILENQELDDNILESEKFKEKRIEEIKQKIEVELNPPVDKNIIGTIITKDVFGYSIPIKIPDNMKHVPTMLRRTFMKIKGKSTLRSGEEGIEFDIDNIIQNKVNKNVTDIFIDEIEDIGLNVVILLDTSGSMCGYKLNRAIIIFLILYEAIKSLKNVNFEIYAFSGSGHSAYMTPVVKMNEERIKTLDVANGYGFTHTYHAVQYVANILNRKIGKKLLIILTDGLPESCIGREKPIEWTRMAIWDARRKGIKVYSIIINSQISDDKLKYIFGREDTWTKIDDVFQAGKLLIGKVSNEIIRNMWMG